MLKNNKLLYILPEMSFTASVGETPKADYYFVQTFHQINGEFMKDENFIHESLKKLFERVEEGTYTLVLPDFLFTDTIINVPETDDVKIAQYLRDQLLPRIEVSTFSHETRTSVLLQRKTTSKVQLSAFEKELAASLKLAIGARNITIDDIVPLSWALKAAVSLEPSLTIAQVGERLYLAEHYIGINQTISTPINDLDVLAESVRTLKGSDPNLQTTYLFTSELVEEKLKKFLLKTLPVQQLTENTDAEAKIPPYVKQIIEVTARTLSLTDFAVPRFTLQADDLLGQLPALPVSEATVVAKEEKVATTETSEESIDATPAEKKTDVEVPPATVAATTSSVARTLDLNAAPATPSPEEVKASEPETAAAPVVETKVAPEPQAAPAATPVPEAPAVATAPAVTPEVAAPPAVPTPAPVVPEVTPETPNTKTEPSAPEAVPQLSFMTPKKIGTETAPSDKTEKTPAKNDKKDDTISSKDKKIVSKKKGNMSSFIKKLLLFLLIFIIVIALGIGVGVAILALNGKDVFKSDDIPAPEAEVLPTPEPSVEPVPVVTATPEAEVEEEEIDPADYSVKVVNATSVGGLAGKAKTSLETAGFTNVQTGNAAGTYDEEGTFVLMKEKSTALIKALEEATDRKMTYDEDYQVEDATGKFDAVIVLNEE